MTNRPVRTRTGCCDRSWISVRRSCVNVIVRPELLARQRRETLDSRLLAASGVWQVVSGVRHLVAQYFEDLTPLLGGLRTSSREFH